jgi:hypothetical protein
VHTYTNSGTQRSVDGPLSKLVDETDSKSVPVTPGPGSSPGRAILLLVCALVVAAFSIKSRVTGDRSPLNCDQRRFALSVDFELQNLADFPLEGCVALDDLVWWLMGHPLDDIGYHSGGTGDRDERTAQVVRRRCQMPSIFRSIKAVALSTCLGGLPLVWRCGPRNLAA